MQKKILFFVALSFLSGLPLLAQKSDVSVTVYNQNLALVRDVRKLSVERGDQLLRFRDVAAQIDPTSVHLRSLTAPQSFAVLEQNFEYDLVNGDKILRKYVDHEIELFTSGRDTLRGVLLNAGNELVLSLPNGEIRMLQKKDIRAMNFPKLPEGLITRPSLIWLVHSDKKQNHRIETEYLTRGLNWHAEYVSILNDAETQMDITAWVSVENNSGAAYKDARLKLVAGDVHTVKRLAKPAYTMTRMESVAAVPPVSEKGFFEYHLYTINRKTTLNNNQVKQITLFDASAVKFDKKYLYEGQRQRDQVKIYTRFKNSAKNKLGMPFPAGKFRVYKKDTDGGMVFIGEDLISHTPKDEWVETLLGNAFDIKAERKLLDTKNIGAKKRQETVEITLRNHKKVPVIVHVVEYFNFRSPDSEWRIIEFSRAVSKKENRTAEWLVKIKAEQESKLTYTVEYKW